MTTVRVIARNGDGRIAMFTAHGEWLPMHAEDVGGDFDHIRDVVEVEFTNEIESARFAVGVRATSIALLNPVPLTNLNGVVYSDPTQDKGAE